MATWHPPIPAGRLYSSEALDLGPALAMLVWCYDQIDRDGRIEVQLSAVATDIGKPYGTIKDWWRMLRAGPFFCEQIDRGKRGWVVRMSEDWIDWHVMKNNYPSKSSEGRNVNPEENEVPVKAPSKSGEGRNINLKETAYKEDHHDQKPDRTLRAKRAPPTGDHQRLLAAYQEALGYKIPNGGKEGPAAKKILAAGYTVEQTIGVYQQLKTGFWADKHLSLHKVYEELGAVLSAPKGYRNGTHQNGRSAHRQAEPRTDELNAYLASLPDYSDD